MTMRPRLFFMMLALLVTAPTIPLHTQEPAFGRHFGGPVRASLAVGVMWMETTRGYGRGPMLIAEPGLRGHRLSAGYLFSRGQLASYASVRATGRALKSVVCHREDTA